MIVGAETRSVRHLKVRLYDGGVLLEPCEDVDCTVAPDGRAGCGRLACPACGDGVPPGAHGSASGRAGACRCGAIFPLPR